MLMFGVAALVLGAIVADDPPPPGGDLGRLQGVWEADVGPGRGSPIVLTIRGTTCEVRSTDGDGEAVVTRAELAIDPAADPPTWDATRRTAADGRAMPDLKGLYRLERDEHGDVLRLANNGPGKPRPRAFAPVVDGLPVVTRFRRPAAPRPPAS